MQYKREGGKSCRLDKNKTRAIITAFNFHIMPELQTPTLETSLLEGHSAECENIQLYEVRDLLEIIQATAQQAREALDELMESDLEFAGHADFLLDQNLHQFARIKNALLTLDDLQRSLNASELTQEEKEAFWIPIAKCYAQVQATLTKIITPFEDRENLKIGQTLSVPVRAWPTRGSRRGIGMTTQFSRFKYRIGSRAVGYFEFTDRHLTIIPDHLKRRLIQEEELDIPIKIISAERGMLTIAEIDIAALEKCFGKTSP